MSDQRPHSRACGLTIHEHGEACHSNCPTCHGKRVESSFSYVAGTDLGKSICEVLGIDTTQVHKMTIEMDVDGPANVIIEAWVPDDNGELVETISRYRLVE